MEPTIGLFDVKFVTQDSVVGETPTYRVDQMHESQEGMSILLFGEVARVDPLVDGLSRCSVVGEIVGDSPLGYRLALFVDRCLLL